MFTLVEYCKLSYTEAWNMPISVRKWWMERFHKELEDRKKAEQNPHSNG